MDNISYLKYKDGSEFEFDIEESSFVTFLGSGNKIILKTLLNKNKNAFVNIDDFQLNDKTVDKMRRNIAFIFNEHLNTFVGETVKDEIAFSMENLNMTKDDMNTRVADKSEDLKLDDLLEKDPNSLGITDKVKLKIVGALVYNPKVIILQDILSELDYSDKLRVVTFLKEYASSGNIVLNFTSDIEESVYGQRIIVSSKEKILMDGNTLSVLNEEKILKRLGLGLPFIIELNKYLMDYGIIKKYELDIEKLVNKIWK